MGIVRELQYRSRLRHRLEDLSVEWATPTRYRPPLLHRQQWADRIRQGRDALRRGRQGGAARRLIPQH